MCTICARRAEEYDFPPVTRIKDVLPEDSGRFWPERFTSDEVTDLAFGPDGARLVTTTIVEIDRLRPVEVDVVDDVYVGPGQPTTDQGAPTDGPVALLGDRFWQGRGAVYETGDAAQSTATTYSIEVGQSFYGRLDNGTELDWVAVHLEAGQTYQFRLLGFGSDYLPDPLFRLYNSDGVEVAFDDDGFPNGGISGYGDHQLASRLVYAATTTGTYYMQADGYSTDFGDYLMTATNHDPFGMVLTADEIAWQLINNGLSFFGAPNGAAFDVGVDGSLTFNITALTAEGQILAREALLAWTNVTGIQFVETAGAAEITFDDSAAGINAYAQPITSGTTITSSTIMVTEGWLTQFGTTLDSYSFETYIHEIGHALGLAHGGNYNGSADFGTDNFYRNDSLAWSIMSYMQADNDEFDNGGPNDWNTYVDAAFRYLVTPQIADIIAIQALYGNYNGAFTGNTTWGFNSNTGNTALDTIVNEGALAAFTIYDNGGTDTMDFSGYDGGQIISLLEESMSSVLGGRHNVAVARGVTIENAIGGSGQDTVYGNEGANVINGGAGSDALYGAGGDDHIIGGAGGDYLYGGLGVDTLDYSASSAGVTVTVSSGAGSASGGDAEFDVVEGFENVIGSGDADQLTGSNVANRLEGRADADVLRGMAGSDQLFGGGGNDILEGGADADLLDGGGGIDTVRYSDATSAVRVNLSTGLGGQWAVGDTYTSIENAIGSTYDDQLVGDGLNNNLQGGGGADDLRGGGGDDQLFGNSGDDVMLGSTGADTISGGDGLDTASYAGSAAGVSVNLTAGTASGGDATGDVLSSIENVTGSSQADVLVGTSGVNVLNGGNGDDDLTGGAGADTLIGGAGIDTVRYSDATSGAKIYLSTGTGGAWAAGDTFQDIENVVGSSYDDLIVGNGADNSLQGGGGADEIKGGSGQDVLGGASGDDVLEGGEGNDNLSGGDNRDTLQGDEGDDILNGGSGNDKLFAGAGVDTVLGGSGDDKLNGGSDNDFLDGAQGNDILTGGSGDDRFDFRNASGTDTITDFRAGAGVRDVILFSAGLFTNLADVKTHTTNDGLGNCIIAKNGISILLQGVTKNDLVADDFEFIAVAPALETGGKGDEALTSPGELDPFDPLILPAGLDSKTAPEDAPVVCPPGEDGLLTAFHPAQDLDVRLAFVRQDIRDYAWVS